MESNNENIKANSALVSEKRSGSAHVQIHQNLNLEVKRWGSVHPWKKIKEDSRWRRWVDLNKETPRSIRTGSSGRWHLCLQGGVVGFKRCGRQLCSCSLNLIYGFYSFVLFFFVSEVESRKKVEPKPSCNQDNWSANPRHSFRDERKVRCSFSCLSEMVAMTTLPARLTPLVNGAHVPRCVIHLVCFRPNWMILS